MNYYDLYKQALAARLAPNNEGVVYALLALAEQVQGLRRDLGGDCEEITCED